MSQHLGRSFSTWNSSMALSPVKKVSKARLLYQEGVVSKLLGCYLQDKVRFITFASSK